MITFDHCCSVSPNTARNTPNFDIKLTKDNAGITCDDTLFTVFGKEYMI